MPITRRIFMRGGAMALVGTAVVPAFLERSVLAQAAAAKASRKRLVVLFQRGAADGLNLVVPYREQAYYALRPTIAIQPKQVLDLDGFFGLHPAMQPLLPLYRSGHLAVIHAAGSPDPSRSHFDAQDFMESGTPGVKSTQDGWLNRALCTEDLRQRRRETAFRAVALGPVVPRTLAGHTPAIAIGNVQDFAVGGHPTPAEAGCTASKYGDGEWPAGAGAAWSCAAAEIHGGAAAAGRGSYATGHGERKFSGYVCRLGRRSAPRHGQRDLRSSEDAAGRRILRTTRLPTMRTIRKARSAAV